MNDLKNVLTEFSEKINSIATNVETKYKGEYKGYNILDYLTKHHLEEFHTSLISDLLNPKGKHSNGGVFLKAFIEVALSKDRDESAGFARFFKQLQGFNDEDYSDAVVEKEFQIRDTKDPLIYGRIDVFIRFASKKINLVLENKIYSSEGVDQLKRYDGYCKTLEEDFSILYLTLHGDVPTSSKGIDYVSLSYDKQIEKWLEQCSKLTNDNALKEGLNAYKNMLHTKFFDSKYERLMKEITDFIINQPNKELLKHQVEIKDALIPVRNYYRDEFFRKVVDRLRKKYQVEIVNEGLKTIDIKDIWYRKYNGILIKDKNLTYTFNDESKTMYFLIEHDWYELYYGFVIIVEKNGPPVYEKDFSENENVKEVRESIKGYFKTESIFSSQEMFAQRVFFPLGLNNKLSFPDDRLNYEFATQSEVIVDSFLKGVEEYLKVYQVSFNNLKSETK